MADEGGSRRGHTIESPKPKKKKESLLNQVRRKLSGASPSESSVAFAPAPPIPEKSPDRQHFPRGRTASSPFPEELLDRVVQSASQRSVNENIRLLGAHTDNLYLEQQEPRHTLPHRPSQSSPLNPSYRLGAVSQAAYSSLATSFQLPPRSSPLPAYGSGNSIHLPSLESYGNASNYASNGAATSHLSPISPQGRRGRLASFVPALRRENKSRDKDLPRTPLEDPAFIMESLQARPANYSVTKVKALEDARKMQNTTLEEAKKAGRDPPKFALMELIGKGTFGRVYKAKDVGSAAIVAVKILDIDEADTQDPRNTDSYAEFVKEINALKLLSAVKARNINHVIEATAVGKNMWLVTEYCGGGSIATLMKPTKPSGLQEKWIIPILREMAEAVKWVHQSGLIHRDIKCANVLITEQGSVQLCDFGVAGMLENRKDKRSTIVGTPHWMAPELFENTATYGKEVDIWGFGAMIYEIATGLPPLVSAKALDPDAIRSAHKQGTPRLEGSDYSVELCDLVAFCLREKPDARPTIEQVQKHPYIHNTESKYPTASLTHLIVAFKLWEDHGGSRNSLFIAGGAHGPTDIPATAMSNDEWNFHTTADFDLQVRDDPHVDRIYDAYGSGVEISADFEETARPAHTPKRARRRPPQALTPNRSNPLEKVFDPNTMSNYNDNSEARYRGNSDLPLREFDQQAIRDTTVDVKGRHIDMTGEDMATLRSGRRGRDNMHSGDEDFNRSTNGDLADTNQHRKTQDWKFPSMGPSSSADPDVTRFPSNYQVPRPEVTPGSGGRPPLVHHPTEPVGNAFGSTLSTSIRDTRISMRESLIDLDLSVPEPPLPLPSRPSTAHSDVGSLAGESDYSSAGDAFELERHASILRPARHIRNESSATNDTPEASDVSDVEGTPRYEPYSDSEYQTAAPPRTALYTSSSGLSERQYSMTSFPNLPSPPSSAVLVGSAPQHEMIAELDRIVANFTAQLTAFRDVYTSPDLRSQDSSRHDRRDL